MLNISLKAPQAQYADSYLITLFYGTGSMNYEYESAAKAHQYVFSYLGNQKQDYQFGEQLQSGHFPFLCAGSASITKAFKQIFQGQQKIKINIKKIFALFFQVMEKMSLILKLCSPKQKC